MKSKHPYLDQKRPLAIYFVILAFLGLAVYFYGLDDTLDLGRYYGAIDRLNESTPLLEFISDISSQYTDFIYFTSLFIARKLSIPYNFVTFGYLSIYFIAIVELIRKNFKFSRGYQFVLFGALMSVPFIWVHAISRNLAAFAFIYLAINAYIGGKWKTSIFLAVCGVFTHYSSLIYVVSFIAAICLKKVNINKKLVGVLYLLLLIFSFITPAYLINLITSVVDESSRYATYGNARVSSIFLSSYIGYGDKLPTLFLYLYSCYLVLANPKKDVMYWGLFILSLMLSFFILSSATFTQRIIMIMPIFIAWNSFSAYNYGSPVTRKSVFLLSLVGIMCGLAHLYSYRTYY